ncbi:MAG: DUF3276 family protein [Candidatus Lokiarchaeota archaeon]|nr:DUF3276 family protein [Candidatus Lokiarchaeota archaeon]
MTFIVGGVETRKTKAGADYLALKIGDKTVSFFDSPDVKVPVKAGDAITCDLKQVRNFWNGKNLRVVDAKAAAVTPFPEVSPATPAPAAATLSPKGAGQPSDGSWTVKGGSRTYFVDVKRDGAGQKYMTITESSGKGGERHQIVVFADSVDGLADALEQAKKALK